MSEPPSFIEYSSCLVVLYQSENNLYIKSVCSLLYPNRSCASSCRRSSRWPPRWRRWRQFCVKVGLPGKSILGDYFQDNRTSRRPFLSVRISFPGRPIFIQFVPGPAAERRPLVLGAAVAQRQAEPGQQEEEGHMHLKLVYPHADIY